MCRDLLLPQSCPRGASCTFAHTQDEMERYRSQKKNMKNMSEAEHSATCSMNSSPSVRYVLIKLDIGCIICVLSIQYITASSKLCSVYTVHV